MNIRITVPIVLLFSGVLMLGCSEEPMNYKQKVKRHRFEKDKHFRYADNSPLPDKIQKVFTSLNYFPIDTQYHVVAEINRLKDGDTFRMAYTNGQKRQYRKFAQLAFQLKGESRTLYVYKNIEAKQQSANDLFIPFYDQTNGESTYGGGRYLDIEPDKDDTTMLDFNKAYNPYCAYNEEFTCPIPPAENELKLKIKAGEKKFKK